MLNISNLISWILALFCIRFVYWFWTPYPVGRKPSHTFTQGVALGCRLLGLCPAIARQSGCCIMPLDYRLLTFQPIAILTNIYIVQCPEGVCVWIEPGDAAMKSGHNYALFFMIQQMFEFRKNVSRPYERFVQKCQFFISKIALKLPLEKFQSRKN